MGALVRFYPEIATMILTMMLCLGAHKLSVTHLQNEQRAALEKQASDFNHSCELDKQLTENNANVLEQKNAALAAQLDNLKRLRRSSHASCIVPVANPASGNNAGKTAPKFSGQNGIRAEYLLDFSAEAEGNWNTLESCRSFIRDTWKLKGQPLH